MKLKAWRVIGGVSLLALAAGCSGGGGGDDRVDLATFVRQQITTNTSDTAEPVDINGIEFRGLTSGDPAQFSDLFAK
jgi:hypothetical protein